MIIHVDLEYHDYRGWRISEWFELSCAYIGEIAKKMQEEIEDSIVFSDLGIEILLGLWFILWKR